MRTRWVGVRALTTRGFLLFSPKVKKYQEVPGWGLLKKRMCLPRDGIELNKLFLVLSVALFSIVIQAFNIQQVQHWYRSGVGVC